MASFSKVTLPSGAVRWRASWREAGKNGTRRQRAKLFESERAARTHCRLVESEIEGAGVGDPNDYTVGSFCDHWLELLPTLKTKISPTTMRGYRQHLERARPFIGHIRLAKLSAFDLDQAYAKLLKKGGRNRVKRDGAWTIEERPLSPQSVKHVAIALGSALTQAKKWKLIPANPVRDSSPPSPGKSPALPYSAADIAAVLEAAARAELAGDPEPLLIANLLIASGIRRGELLGLAFDDIDWTAATITIRRSVVEVDGKPVLRDQAKSAAGLRVIAIAHVLLDPLRAQRARIAGQKLLWGADWNRASPDFIFPGPAGGMRLPMNVTLAMRQLMRQAKVTGPAPVHGMRHSHTSALVALGTDMKTVQSRVGHATPSITLGLYAHKSDDRDRVAADQFAAILRPKAAG